MPFHTHGIYRNLFTKFALSHDLGIFVGSGGAVLFMD